MVKKYPQKFQSTENKHVNPSTAVINQLLNYSKSIEMKPLKQAKVLVHLN
jgi:hypothetical protein